MKSVITVLLLSLSISLSAQLVYNSGEVVATTANVRQEPTTESQILTKLARGTNVTVIKRVNQDWFQIQDENQLIGYMHYSTIQVDEQSGWYTPTLSNGINPTCENIKEKFDYSGNQELRIQSQSSNDCIVKLMNKYTDECIRIAYIRGQSSFTMKNIPNGTFYVKMAFGTNFQKKYFSGLCYIQFRTNPSYKLGESQLDYDGGVIYTLTLNTILQTGTSLQTNQISEAEFNE